MARRGPAAPTPTALAVHPTAGALFAQGATIINKGQAIASAPGPVGSLAANDASAELGSFAGAWIFSSGNQLYASDPRPPGYAPLAAAPSEITASAINAATGDVYFAAGNSVYKISKASGAASPARSFGSAITALSIHPATGAVAAAVAGEGVYVDGTLKYREAGAVAGLGYDRSGNLYHAIGSRITRNGAARPGLAAGAPIEAMAINPANGEATYWSAGALASAQTTVYLVASYPSPHGFQRYAIAAPQNYLTHKYPALLWIHGGGWIGGSLADDQALMDDLASRGFLTASVEYSLAPVNAVNASYPSPSNPSALHPSESVPLSGVPEAVARAVESDYGILIGPAPKPGLPFPAGPNDVRAFETYMRSTPSLFNIDASTKITIAGASAGAHLAMLEAATSPYAYSCLAEIAGPATFSSESLWSGPLGSAGSYVWSTMLLNFAPAPADRSAIDILSKSASITSKTGRSLVIHSPGDTLVPYAQGQAAAASLGADFPAMRQAFPFLRPFGAKTLPDLYAGHNLATDEVWFTLSAWLAAHCK